MVVTLESHPLLNFDPKAALIDTFVTTNTALTTTTIQYFSSGCTCCVVYKKGNVLYVANVGDSRAVLASKGSNNQMTARDLSRDHKPDDPDEKLRITRAGGHVSPPPGNGLSARVWLDAKYTMIGLAMSRSIGGFLAWHVDPLEC